MYIKTASDVNNKFFVPPFRSRDRQLDFDFNLGLSTLRLRLDIYHPRLRLDPCARLGHIPTCYIQLLRYPQDCGGRPKVAEVLEMHCGTTISVRGVAEGFVDGVDIFGEPFLDRGRGSLCVPVCSNFRVARGLVFGMRASSRKTRAVRDVLGHSSQHSKGIRKPRREARWPTVRLEDMQTNVSLLGSNSPGFRSEEEGFL